jgi:hypothetical protein
VGLVHDDGDPQGERLSEVLRAAGETGRATHICLDARREGAVVMTRQLPKIDRPEAIYAQTERHAAIEPSLRVRACL